MNGKYKFNHADMQILGAIKGLLRKLAAPGSVAPAQLVTVAKVLHVLSRLPCSSENVQATIGISLRVKQEGCSSLSYCRFSVTEAQLDLTCGGSEYTEGEGSDSFTTMEWFARPGRQSEFNGTWDHAWMREDEYSYPPIPEFDFSSCEISVEDDDNPLLDEEEDAGEDIDEGLKPASAPHLTIPQ
jgi:hypothetical protein